MPYGFPNNTFDPKDFLQSLMREMKFDREPEDKRQPLEKMLLNQMNEVVLNTASLHLNREVMEELAVRNPDEKDFEYFLQQVIRYSPKTQLAILHALDQFYDQTLDAFKALCK